MSERRRHWYTARMSRRVLLTGVSGFVGGALGSHLRKLGYDVIGVSRSAPRPACCTSHLTHDLSEPVPESWPHADVIVHCAALASPWASPAAYRLHNVDATRNVLAYAERVGASHFVFISSSSVHYAHGDQVDLTEDTPLPTIPINEYAATKRQGEELVRRSRVPWTILRPRAVFGPGDTVLFPRILRAAERGGISIPDLQSHEPSCDSTPRSGRSSWVRCAASNALSCPPRSFRICYWIFIRCIARNRGRTGGRCAVL